MILTDAYEIARFIKEAEKKTVVKLYVNGELENFKNEKIKIFGGDKSKILIGEAGDIYTFLNEYGDKITDYFLEYNSRNSAIPLLDITKLNARIEPGSIIRDHVQIGNNVVVMMGAVINIGASIGDNSMIDMNAVVGARGTIGKNVHVGAGAVIAGVLEPPSKEPVIIEDNVIIGANAVILEGVKVHEGAVIGAGAIVTENVPSKAVVIGVKGKVVKYKDEKTMEKTKLMDDLRTL